MLDNLSASSLEVPRISLKLRVTGVHSILSTTSVSPSPKEISDCLIGLRCNIAHNPDLRTAYYAPAFPLICHLPLPFCQ
jgi:hypothetical protein